MIGYKEVNIPKCREFGLVMGIALLCLAAFSFYKGYEVYQYLVIVGIFILLVRSWMPQILKPFGFLWLNLGMLMHTITFPIMMVFLFFFILYPYAVFLKLIGVKFLQEHKKGSDNSYWHANDNEKINITYFKRQF